MADRGLEALIRTGRPLSGLVTSVLGRHDLDMAVPVCPIFGELQLVLRPKYPSFRAVLRGHGAMVHEYEGAGIAWQQLEA